MEMLPHANRSLIIVKSMCAPSSRSISQRLLHANTLTEAANVCFNYAGEFRTQFAIAIARARPPPEFGYIMHTYGRPIYVESI